MLSHISSSAVSCTALITDVVAHAQILVLYAVGIVELELESTSALVLLLFVVPLAFTLSGFLLWILYALNGTHFETRDGAWVSFYCPPATIAQLATRKQNYKLSMFKWLHRILLLTVLVIAIFFVVSSLTFSGRLAEGAFEKRHPKIIYNDQSRLRCTVLEGAVVAT